MRNFKTTWHSLALREKQMVAAGIFAIVIFLLYLIIWLPISNKAESLRGQIEQNHQLLTRMESADSRIQSLQQSMQSSTSTSAKSVLSIIQNEIAPAGFSKNLSTLRQIDAHSVQLNLQNVSFDSLIKWLAQLSKTRGLQVTQMTVLPTGTQGLVTAEVILKG